MSSGQWMKAANATEVRDGEVAGCEIAGRRIAIYNLEGKFYATDNICTHGLALLSDGYLEGSIIECPLHAGQFNVCTGKALAAPVTSDLQTYPVKVEANFVFVWIGPAQDALVAGPCLAAHQ